MEGSGSSNWRPPPQADQSMAVPVDAVAPNNEWRSQLPPEARHRIVSKIMDTLRKHLPISAPEGLGELNKIAVRFEEKIYNAATCQADYLRKISMKMLTMEQKNANPTVPSHMAANSNMGGQNAVDTAGNIVPMHSQVPSMSIGISSQPPAKQILATNLQSNIVSTEVSTSTPAPPSVTGMNQSTINIGQNPHLQATPAISQNSLNNSAGQGVAPNLFASAQRQLHGRLQQPMVSQQQQQQSQNQLVYQQQQLLKQKVPHPSLAQPQMSQSQKSQSLLPASLQPQQTMISMPSGLQTSSAASLQNQQSPVLQSVSQNLQQNQQNPVQQGGSIYASQTRQQQMPRQSVLQQQASSILQQSSSFGQQPGVLSTQQQLFGQQSTMTNMAQRHFGQQNIMSELQQQQHPRLPTQQNNLLTSQQSQQTLNQQQTVPMHQQQLTSQTNLTVLQQQLPSQQQQQQSSQLPQHQSQLLGSQPSTTNVQQHSQSTHMLQHSKAAGQVAQTSATLMQLQGQGPTQQHVAHLQSQSIQLQQQQQQLSMQQQTNSLREMHPRHPASGVSLQPQTDQQKQETQPQRVLAEAPSTSVDSTSQTSQAGTDMQEEIYQKIRSLKELYCSDLQEMHHKLTTKLLQHESSILSAKQSEQLENLKKYRTSVERMLQVLQLQKGNISLVLKDRLPGYEKQIQQMVASSKKKYTPQLAGQQFQHPGGISQPIQQQTSQISQLQQSDALLNQVQPMNMQTSVGSVQSAVSNMQSGSSTALGSHLISQNPMNSLQPYSNMESSQGNVLASSQQGAIGSLQQSSLGTMHQASINAQQQNSISALMQSTVNTLSSGGNPLQQNSNTLQHQQVKQEQQQQLMQAQQVKQLQQRHLQLQQHQLIQQQQKQQILQQQPQLQQQLLQQKQLQQQVQVQPHQIHQLQQSNEMNPRHPGMKSGIFQSHNQAGHRQTYYQQQIKTSSPFSPQAPSPLMSQHSSPQVDQQALPSLLKSGTPIQSTTPPFIVPSPSTPLAPSPLPGDHEKPPPTISSFPNAANVGQQQPVPRQAQVQSLAVGTPGISASPLLAEFDGFQTNIPSAIAGKSSFSEQPIDRLIKAVKSSSSSVLRCAISDIASVVGMIDRIAGAAPGNGSRAAVGEDLAAMTKCRLQARNFMSQDGSATSRKMKRQISAMPLNVVPSTDISDESIGESPIIDISENEFTATSDLKRPKLEANHALLDEIRDINLQLIDTIVDVADDDIDAAAEGGEGTVVKFSYCAIALSPNLKSRLATSDVTPISPLRLLVPTKYPSCSPIVLDKIPAELTGDTEDLSAKARLRFGSSLRGLPHVMSLKDMAKTWDVSSREVILEYAQQNGGGSFSSRYGTWENCVAA